MSLRNQEQQIWPMHKETRWIGTISNGYEDSKAEDDYQLDQIFLLNLLFDCASPTSSLFYNHKVRWRNKIPVFPLDWIRKSNWSIRQEIIWERSGSCTLNARMFAPSDDRIYWMHHGRHKWNQDCVKFLTVWKIGNQIMDEHPCAFPIDFLLRAIAATTDVCDLVCDPYAESGTTLRAAKDLGRRAIGIEINEDYCKIAVERLRQGVLIAV